MDTIEIVYDPSLNACGIKIDGQETLHDDSTSEGQIAIKVVEWAEVLCTDGRNFKGDFKTLERAAINIGKSVLPNHNITFSLTL